MVSNWGLVANDSATIIVSLSLASVTQSRESHPSALRHHSLYPITAALFRQDHAVNHVDHTVLAFNVSLDHIRAIHLDPIDRGNGHTLPLHRCC